MTDLSSLLRAYPFLIPIVVGLLTECVKVAVSSIRRGTFAFDRILQSGGFPSAHAAFVTSLLIVVWRKTGLGSVEFAIAAVFAMLVLYDAVNSRREIGLQAEALNRLQHWRQFKTEVGHTVIEVVGGVVFGVGVTWVGIWMST